MKFYRLLPVMGILVASTCWAVYAPIPEQEQGKDFSISARAGIATDSNIFGAPTDEISSTVYSFSPRLKYNSSVTDQTFVSLAYTLTLDHFTKRPGKKTLDSHDIEARVAHAFAAATTIDITDYYTISKNPESLLAGVPLNTDQSFKRNQVDARFTTNAGQKAAVTIKARLIDYSYDNPVLATGIDRMENLLGVEASYDFLPETKLVGEYRHQNVNYDTSGGNKDKRSNFLIGGFDYNVAKKVTASGRFGGEWRKRESERSTTAPYVELSSKFDFAEQSYLSAGYIYTLEEATDVATYTDTKVNRFFVNIQHALSALIVASGSVTYEPSQLQGRRGFSSISETTSRFGVALTYLVNKNWTVSATFDYDKVSSDLASREMTRDRFGLNVALSF